MSQSSFEGAGNTEVVVTAVDDSGNEESCTIALTLENNPDAITVTANDDDLSVSEGETITFNVLANDFASDGSALEVQDLVLANPADGTLVDNGDGTYDFTPAEGFVGEVILTYIAKSEDASLFFEGTGNFYEFVAQNGITWQDARIAAEARTLNGVNGYLVTVTSQEENDFILSKLEGQGWMGGSDVAVDDEWRWVTGPEGEEENGAGRLFWTGKADGMPINGVYSNWEPGEPNDFRGNNENYAHFRIEEGKEGQWNDLPNATSEIQGYVVEYGGIG
ncbi:MAG: cadherin-like domain-containing protein, partial [Bacteroidota bacterium]